MTDEMPVVLPGIIWESIKKAGVKLPADAVKDADVKPDGEDLVITLRCGWKDLMRRMS